MDTLDAKVYLTDQQANAIAKNVAHKSENPTVLCSLVQGAVYQLTEELGEKARLDRALKRMGYKLEKIVVKEGRAQKGLRALAEATRPAKEKATVQGTYAIGA